MPSLAGLSEDDEGPSENERMREALKQCKNYLRWTTGSWWNDSQARDLMTKHINPALGLDPWAP